MKSLLATIFTLAIIAAVPSYSAISATELSQTRPDNRPVDNKESMLKILEALESGQEYERSENWSGSNYLSIDIQDFYDFHEYFIEEFSHAFDDFGIDHGEFWIDEEFLRNLENRIEDIDLKLEKRLEEIMERLDTATFREYL